MVKKKKKSVKKKADSTFDIARDFKKFKKGVKIEIREIEKNIKEDILEVEALMKARRKFLIKLAWTVGLIAILLIISHFWLRVWGKGI